MWLDCINVMYLDHLQSLHNMSVPDSQEKNSVKATQSENIPSWSLFSCFIKIVDYLMQGSSMFISWLE